MPSRHRNLWMSIKHFIIETHFNQQCVKFHSTYSFLINISPQLDNSNYNNPLTLRTQIKRYFSRWTTPLSDWLIRWKGKERKCIGSLVLINRNQGRDGTYFCSSMIDEEKDENIWQNFNWRKNERDNKQINKSKEKENWSSRTREKRNGYLEQERPCEKSRETERRSRSIKNK